MLVIHTFIFMKQVYLTRCVTTIMGKSILVPDDHLCLQPDVLDQRWPWREDDSGLVLDGRHREGSPGGPDNPVGPQPHAGRGLQETILDQRLQKRKTWGLLFTYYSSHLLLIFKVSEWGLLDTSAVE